jgi:hypothetical protein
VTPAMSLVRSAEITGNPELMPPDWSRLTLEPYRDCPEGRAELSVNVWLGAVSIGF